MQMTAIALAHGEEKNEEIKQQEDFRVNTDPM